MGTCLSAHECPVHSCSASSSHPHGHMGLYWLMGDGGKSRGVTDTIRKINCICALTCCNWTYMLEAVIDSRASPDLLISVRLNALNVFSSSCILISIAGGWDMSEWWGEGGFDVSCSPWLLVTRKCLTNPNTRFLNEDPETHANLKVKRSWRCHICTAVRIPRDLELLLESLLLSS